ncbi:hypothetical protein BDN70DRAFT_815341, partial [Pholiota conissans]
LYDITILNYTGKLSNTVTGLLRNLLIRSYQKYKGNACQSADWHPAIKWNATESKVKMSEDNGSWNIEINYAIIENAAITQNKKIKLNKQLQCSELSTDKLDTIDSIIEDEYNIHKNKKSVYNVLKYAR